MKGTLTLTFLGGSDKVTDVQGWSGGSLGTVIDGGFLARTVALLVARLVGVVVAAVLGAVAVGLVLVPWVRLGSLTGVAVGWLIVSCIVGML